MANALPLGHRKLVNPPPYPEGGTLGDSLDTSIKVMYSAIPRNVVLYIQEQDTSPMKVDSSVEPFTKLVAMLEQGMASLS